MEDEIYSCHRNNLQSTAIRTDLSIAIFFSYLDHWTTVTQVNDERTKVFFYLCFVGLPGGLEHNKLHIDLSPATYLRRLGSIHWSVWSGMHPR